MAAGRRGLARGGARRPAPDPGAAQGGLELTSPEARTLDAARRPSRVPSPSFATLKRLSFAHSTVYAILLVVWLVPGLHALEFVFGLTHGLGWIAMCLLSIAAVRARVIPLRVGFAVAVIGAVGPFVGSWEFVREQRRREAAAAALAAD